MSSGWSSSRTRRRRLLRRGGRRCAPPGPPLPAGRPPGPGAPGRGPPRGRGPPAGAPRRAPAPRSGPPGGRDPVGRAPGPAGRRSAGRPLGRPGPPGGGAGCRRRGGGGGGMGLPVRETGGLPDLRDRDGGALAGALGPACLNGGGSSAAGWGSSRTTRLAGATLPLEEIVTLGLGALCLVPAAAGGAFATAGQSEPASGAARPCSCSLGLSGRNTAGRSVGGGGGFLAAAGWARTSSSGSGDGGSGCSTTGGGGGGFSRPSRSALRRTRSAWASTMLEE